MDLPAPRSLVLLSGGLDSVVVLWWAQREGHDVEAITFDYPGRPVQEARAAEEVAALARTVLHKADLPFMAEPVDAPHLARAPRGYVPARNAILYAAACYHAEVLDRPLILGGHNADDAARFPDAGPAFFDRYAAILGAGLHLDGRAPPRIALPLARLTKEQVVALGRELGAPLARAWSCYEDGDAPCGLCPACVETRIALPERLARAG